MANREKQPKKLVLLNILDILRRYTDENHRLSQKCQTAHCGRCKPRFVLGEFTSPIVSYRNLPQAPDGMTADCCSLV